MYEGTIPDIREAFIGKDMLLWPSKREGLGLPIIEALSSGLPVLIADGYMMKQWIVAGEHGVVVPAAPLQGSTWLPEMQLDEDTLANEIKKLCDDSALIAKYRAAVERDREVWIWSWQPAILRRQLANFILKPHALIEPESYLPDFILGFERRRAVAGRLSPEETSNAYAMQSVPE